MSLVIDDTEVDIDADTVILAGGAQSNLDLSQRMERSGVETHVVGDCGGVGYIEGAIRTGNEAGRKV